MNGTHKLMVCADKAFVNLLGENTDSTNRNIEVKAS